MTIQYPDNQINSAQGGVGAHPWGSITLDDKKSVARIREVIGEFLQRLQNPQENAPSIRECEALIDTQMREVLEEISPHLKIDLEGYGNKHKNLILLSLLVKLLGLDWLKIPLPKGVSSEEVEKLLRAEEPLIFTMWDELGKLYCEHKGPATSFLQNEEAAEKLKAIQVAIRKAFQRAADVEDSSELAPEFDEWVKEKSGNGSHLMVRSTGAGEDAENLSNAGGNKSRSYVNPDRKDVYEAMGDVVASYFSKRSMQNRLNMGSNPFESSLQLAVTMQEVIGEKLGGADQPDQIPVSAVLFTNEPTWVGKESFRTVRLSGTHGHGEGVVGNKGIATDSVVMTQSLTRPTEIYTLYDLKKKPNRLAPIPDSTNGTVNLKTIANNETLVEAPAFDKETLAKLYLVAVVIEKFYNGVATDVELVVKGGDIHLVQARAIKRPEQNPTYVDAQDGETEPVIQKEEMEVLVVGQSSVVTARDPKAVMMENSLDQAEKKLGDGIPEATVVAQPEPKNSHPVINFSGMGIPCFYSPQFEKIRSSVEKASDKTPVAICPQTGSLYLWDNKKGNLADFIKKGYVTHPAEFGHSLPIPHDIPKHSGVSPTAPAEIKRLLFQARTAKTHEVALQILRELKEHPWIQQTLITSKEQLEEQASRNLLVEPHVSGAVKALEVLEQQVQRAFDEAMAATSADSGRLQMLFHYKVLELVLLGSHGEGESVGTLSVAGMHPYLEAADSLIDYQKQLEAPAQLADLLFLGTKSPNSELFQGWKTFLLELEQLIQEGKIEASRVEKFKKRMISLDNLKALPLFLTIFFPKEREVSPLEKLETIEKQLSEQDEETLRRIEERRDQIDQLESDLQAFAEPKAFEEMFQRLIGEVNEWNPKDASLPLSAAQWEQTSPLVRAVMINTMAHLVDVYDSSIKAMKASTQYSTEEKVVRFKKMLQEYYRMLEMWTFDEGPATTVNISDAEWIIRDHLGKHVQNICGPSSDNKESQLVSSRGFNVIKTIVGIFHRHIQYGSDPNSPKTAEDLFTAIHQNMNQVIGHLLLSLNVEEELGKSSPDLFKRALERASSIASFGGSEQVMPPEMNMIQISDQSMEVGFHIAMRAHSVNMSLLSDKDSDDLELRVRLVSRETGHLQGIRSLTEVLHRRGILQFKNGQNMRINQPEFTWVIKSTEDLERAYRELKRICFCLYGGVSSLEESIECIFERDEGVQELQKTVLDPSLSSGFTGICAGILTKKINEESIELDCDTALELVMRQIRSSDRKYIFNRLQARLNGEEKKASSCLIKPSRLTEIVLEGCNTKEKIVRTLLRFGFTDRIASYDNINLKSKTLKAICQDNELRQLLEDFLLSDECSTLKIVDHTRELLREGVSPRILSQKFLRTNQSAVVCILDYFIEQIEQGTEHPDTAEILETYEDLPEDFKDSYYISRSLRKLNDLRKG